MDDEVTSEPRSSLSGEQCQKQAVVGTPDYLAPEILLGVGHGRNFTLEYTAEFTI